MEVAVVADHAAGAADVREQAQPFAYLLAASADRVEFGVVVGQRHEDALDLLVDRRREQSERLGRGLLRAEGRVGRVGAENRVHPRPSPRRGGGACRRTPRRLRRSRRARAPTRRSPLATKRCIVPSVASICAPTYAYQPASSAMFSNPASVKKRSSSSSGLIPASTRRNTFRIWASSKMTDEFDCSPSISRAACDRAELGADRGELDRSLVCLDRLTRSHHSRTCAHARLPRARRSRCRP